MTIQGVLTKIGTDSEYPNDSEGDMEEFIGDKIGGTPWISDEFIAEVEQSQWYVLLQLDGILADGYECPIPKL